MSSAPGVKFYFIYHRARGHRPYFYDCDDGSLSFAFPEDGLVFDPYTRTRCDLRVSDFRPCGLHIHPGIAADALLDPLEALRGRAHYSAPQRARDSWALCAPILRLPERHFARRAGSASKAIDAFITGRVKRGQNPGERVLAHAADALLLEEIYAELLHLDAEPLEDEEAANLRTLLVVLTARFSPPPPVQTAVRALLARMAAQTADAALAARMQFQYIRFRALAPGRPSPYAALDPGRLLSAYADSQMLFGAPLYEMMWAQRRRYPALPIPAPMIQIERAIERLGGLATEGLFRRPGALTSVDSIVADAHEGNIAFLDGAHLLDLCTLYKRLLHVPGGLIGRDLTERLVRNQVGSEVVAEMDLLHQNVFKHFIGFMRHATKHVEATRMDAANLGLVFAQTLLWDNSTDPEVIKEIPAVGKALIRELIDDWDVAEFWPMKIPGEP
jgi:hypothetical protein